MAKSWVRDGALQNIESDPKYQQARTHIKNLNEVFVWGNLSLYYDDIPKTFESIQDLLIGQNKNTQKFDELEITADLLSELIDAYGQE